MNLKRALIGTNGIKLQGMSFLLHVSTRLNDLTIPNYLHYQNSWFVAIVLNALSIVLRIGHWFDGPKYDPVLNPIRSNLAIWVCIFPIFPK